MKRLLILISVAALAAFFVACGGDDDDAGAATTAPATTAAGSASATEAPEATPFPDSGPTTLRLGFFANITHSQPLVGLNNGIFEEELGDDVTVEQTTFNAGPSVIEALFAGGWRNRDTWKRFDLRDETAVAGIKFRALKRLRQLAAVRESGGDLLRYLEVAEDQDERLFDLDVPAIWRERRVACPARHWIARMVAGTLDEDAGLFVRFHLDEMKCPWCVANRDDLSRAGKEAELELLVERLRESTRRFLRSRRGPDPV